MISDAASATPEAAVIVAVPCARPSTRPATSTEATEVSLEVHVNAASATAWPFASVADAARRTVSPGSMVAIAGRTSTAAARCATTSEARPDTASEPAPAAAVTTALPLPTAVTRPSASTVTTPSSPDDHVNAAPATACPCASLAVAVRRTVSPSAVSVSIAGTTATDWARCRTTMRAVPDASPERAVTVARPLPTAVTRPSAPTVTTPSSPDDQANAGSATAWPFASTAAAVSRTVSPSAVSVSAAGETSTELAIWST